MAYKCSFLDNESYTAKDVNDIFARIVSGGVIFTDTGYTFGDLNNAQNTAVTEGVTRDVNSCRVVKVGNKYKISKGACFMHDGTAIVFDEDGYEFEITPEVTNYVYLRRNSVANSIDIVVSQMEGAQDSIPLAKIDQDGNIFDRRKYARSKVDILTTSEVRNYTLYFTQCNYTQTETQVVDLGNGSATYIIVWGGKWTLDNKYENRLVIGKNLIALPEDEELIIPIGPSESKRTEFIYCTKQGSNLYIHLSCSFSGSEYEMNIGII